MKKVATLLCILFLLGVGAQSTYANVPISGGTYVIGTDYATIALAIADLNTRGVSGAVTFSVPAGYTETFASSTAGLISITSNPPTATNTVTFQKSSAGVDPLITAALLSGSGAGTYIIKIFGTSYITFNGIDVQENASQPSNADKTQYGYYVDNNGSTGCSYITIENCSVTLDQTNTNSTTDVYDLVGTTGVFNSHNTYSNISAQHAEIGIYIKGYSAAVVGVGNTITGCTASNLGGPNNTFSEGIAATNQNGLTINGCEVKNLTITATGAGENATGIYTSGLNGTNNVIANNKVHDINDNDTFLSGLSSIYVDGIKLSPYSGTDAVTAYNNMIYALGCGGGLSPSASDTALNISAIYCGGYGNFYIYYNSVYLTNTASTYYFNTTCLDCGGSTGGTYTIENNIFKNTYTGGTTRSYCVYYGAATLVTPTVITTSDYNNFDCAAASPNFTGGTGLSFTTTPWANLALLTDLQNGSAQDFDSYQFTTDFTSITPGSENLHLNVNHANGHYIGTPIAGITTDIDGDTRDATYPYIGADEVTAYPLPVELTAFNATVSGKSVNLAWRTATEVNNSGFEVERNAAGTWTQVGFVAGNGTSNSPHNYSYVDAVAAGNYSYRLKQIDHNGAFVYSKTIQAAVGLSPSDYALSQNYPNPFNPTTMITFAVKTDQHASMKVYNMLGQEVMTLFDGDARANQLYQVQFNASSLASGAYFYILQTADSRQVKKMLLLK